MTADDAILSAARAGDDRAFAALVEPHSRELRAHCYRMMGSLEDAEDMLQESLVRAWRGLAGFEGRSTLRTWLYRVATHACLDALATKKRRVMPMDLAPASQPNEVEATPALEPSWLEPFPDALLAGTGAPSPDIRYDERESVTLAFLVAIQLLPPRQRAVLLLRDVLGLSAAETADLLDMSIAAANSALQRARETLDQRDGAVDFGAGGAPDPIERDVLARYVHAWEQSDLGALVAVLRDDAILAMPPIAQWLSGRDAIEASLAAMVFSPDMRGNVRLVATHANGAPAFAAYQRERADQPFSARALHVLGLDPKTGTIASIMAFMNPEVFARFDLPLELGA